MRPLVVSPRFLCCVLAAAGLWLAPSQQAHAAARNPLAPLDYFVGGWNCTGHFTSGKPVQSRDTVSIELAGHWMRLRHAEEPPNGWHVDEWWGYDKTAKQFTVTLFGNFGDMRHYVSTGWDGNLLTLENTANAGFIDRFVFERRSDSVYRVVYSYRNASTAWRVGDEQVCTRDARAPRP